MNKLNGVSLNLRRFCYSPIKFFSNSTVFISNFASFIDKQNEFKYSKTRDIKIEKEDFNEA
jgi:hypothetical protein